MFIFFVLAASLQAVAHEKWAAVVDAGSSGCRVHLYAYDPCFKTIPKIRAAKEAVGRPKKVTPGLSSFAGNYMALVEYLSEIKSELEEKIAHHDVSLPDVEMYFLATGGVRLLPSDEQIRLVMAVEEILSSFGFRTIHVDRIEGKQEGLFAWVAANYLQGHFDDPDTNPKVGVIDFGGASIQVAFAPKETPAEHAQSVSIGGRDHLLYVYSYDGFGGFRAREKWLHASCEAPGNFDECRSHLVHVLKSANKDRPKTGLDGVYQPDLSGEFLGLEHLFEASKQGQIEYLSPEHLSEAGRRACLSDAESKALRLGSTSLCFDFAYFSALFFGEGPNSSFDGLGFSRSEKYLKPVDIIDGQNAVWPLGYLVFRLAGTVQTDKDYSHEKQ